MTSITPAPASLPLGTPHTEAAQRLLLLGSGELGRKWPQRRCALA